MRVQDCPKCRCAPCGRGAFVCCSWAMCDLNRVLLTAGVWNRLTSAVRVVDGSVMMPCKWCGEPTRMIGTMAATFNTEFLSGLLSSADTPNPLKVATAAAVIGGAAYLVALVLTFLLPTPRAEVAD